MSRTPDSPQATLGASNHKRAAVDHLVEFFCNGQKYKLAIAGLTRFTVEMLFASVAQAAVEPIAPFAFSGSSSISFDGLATGTEANGLVVGRLSFGVIVPGVSANGQVIVDGGPGVTGNVNPPNLVSVANLPNRGLTDLPRSPGPPPTRK